MNNASKKIFVAIFILIIILLAVGYYFIVFKNGPKSFSQSEESTKAVDAFNSNNPDQSISTLQGYLQKNSDDVSAQLLLASSYVQKGSLQFAEKDNAQKALDIVNSIIQNDPNNVEAYRIKGYAYEIMQDYPNAFLAYDKALSLDPKNAAVLSNRGHAYSLLGQNSDAEKDYKSALSIDPNLDSTLLNLGRLYVSEKNFVDGEKYLKQVASTTGNSRFAASALQVLGVAEISQGNFIQAKQYLDEALVIDPTLSSAYVERGRAVYFLLPKAPTKADFTTGVNYILDNVSKASSINPNLTSAYLLGATVFGMIDNSKEALVFYNKALSVVDNDISLSATVKVSTKAEINAKIKTLK